jgi:hypothetical protein
MQYSNTHINTYIAVAKKKKRRRKRKGKTSPDENKIYFSFFNTQTKRENISDIEPQRDLEVGVQTMEWQLHPH